jgi:hypothetical protein
VSLRILKDLVGRASYSCTWNSNDFPAGYYSIFLELKDMQGVILDRRIETFKLGISLGEISNFAVTPKYFNIGDNIEISMTFENNGTVNITGQAITKIINIFGDTIKEFRHNFSDLASYESISFNDIWATVGEDKGFYKVISYVSYDGKSTEPKTAVIGTKLPLTTIKTVEDPKYGPNDEWVTSHTIFNLTTSDDIDSNSRIYYRIWYNEKWMPWTEYEKNFTLSDKGKYYIEFYLVDNFGIVEEVHNQTHYVDCPEEMTSHLIEDIKDMGLPKGIENSLTQKVNNVIKLLEKSQKNAAINLLYAFINEVEDLRGTELTYVQADTLINFAEDIIDYSTNI